ncbi:MAG: FMN-binding protein [Candidatus Ventricola sp.]
MKRVGKILLAIACVIGVAVGGICLMMDRQVGKMVAQLDAVAIVAPEQVADGAYEGKAETPLVKVTVEVIVQGHALREIHLLRHENGRGAPAETMLPEMLRQNTSEVDTVSGATLSSKAIRAAVRDALAKGAED